MCNVPEKVREAITYAAETLESGDPDNPHLPTIWTWLYSLPTMPEPDDPEWWDSSRKPRRASDDTD